MLVGDTFLLLAALVLMRVPASQPTVHSSARLVVEIQISFDFTDLKN